ncbi:uncharacterized protein LOC142354814 [Convolutriloba macropyga]|uniref:uncharacterized protein LOC142354814 n=1 Tax=Convolutriloba macropyga TaxID=536237 RepID=UPI003F51C985
MATPWGTETDTSLSSSQNGGGDMSRKQYLDQNSQVAMSATMTKNQDFYQQNPDCKPVINHHREAMLAEKNKPVPWGTLEDLGSNPDQQQVFGKRRSNRDAPAPAPFATAFNDEFPSKGKVVSTGQQPSQSMVQSQITF